MEKWSTTKYGLQRSLTFRNQTELAEFVLTLAKLSDRDKHHADMKIVYNELHLTIVTHDENHQLTEKDWALAEKIDGLILE